MTLTIKQVKIKYNRFALIYNLILMPMEYFMFRKWRKRILRNINGKVLEIGVGTGKNLPYYDFNKISLKGVDISPRMLAKAKEDLKNRGYSAELIVADVESLPFKDDSFDYVVSTFVFCSIPNPSKALKEMKRVLRKEGKIVMLEHVLSKNSLIAFIENIYNPITNFFFGGNINRDIINTIKESSLKVVKEKNLAWKDVFKEIEVKK